jgi:hypothetical protein
MSEIELKNKIVNEVLNEYREQVEDDVKRLKKLIESHSGKEAFEEIDVSLKQELDKAEFKLDKIKLAIDLVKFV